MTHHDKAKHISALLDSDSYDPQELYKYIFEMVQATAYTKRLFSSPQYYEDFSYYMADTMYHRLTSKDKPRINNLVGYLNYTIRGFYDVFSKAEFRQVINTNVMYNGAQVQAGMEEYFRNMCYSNTKGTRMLFCKDYIDNFTRAIKAEMKYCRYAPNKEVTDNLYVSVLLSIITNKSTPFLLDDEQREYLSLLKTGIMSSLQKELEELLSDDELSQGMVESMLSDISSSTRSCMEERIDG